MRLIVMRHAKSDWHAGIETDHERPLNKRGRLEAPMVAERLQHAGFAPDYLLSSDSKRTSETFELMRGHFSRPVPGVFVKELYHAGLEQVRSLAPTVPADARTVMVLGHNPGWEEMVSELVGESIEMKTAYAAVLESDATTLADALRAGERLRLVELIKPKS